MTRQGVISIDFDLWRPQQFIDIQVGLNLVSGPCQIFPATRSAYSRASEHDVKS